MAVIIFALQGYYCCYPLNRKLVVPKSQYAFFNSTYKSHIKDIWPWLLNHPPNRLVTISTVLPLLQKATYSSSNTHNQNPAEKHEKVCNLAALENSVLHIIIWIQMFPAHTTSFLKYCYKMSCLKLYPDFQYMQCYCSHVPGHPTYTI